MTRYDPERDRASLQVVRAALTRWRTSPPVNLELAPWDAFILVGLLQAVVRHPALQPAERNVAELIGRTLQRLVSDQPEVYTLLECGWHPSLDVPAQRAEDTPRGRSGDPQPG